MEYCPHQLLVLVAQHDLKGEGVERIWCKTIDYTYDKVKDKFIAPQPYASWALDSNDDWQPPTAMPEDDKRYSWDEDTTAWVEVTE